LQLIWDYVGHAIARLGVDRHFAIVLLEPKNPCKCKPKCAETGNYGKHLLINMEGVEALGEVAGEVDYDAIVAKQVVLEPCSSEANRALENHKAFLRKLWNFGMRIGPEGRALYDPSLPNFDKLVEADFNRPLNVNRLHADLIGADSNRQ